MNKSRDSVNFRKIDDNDCEDQDEYLSIGHYSDELDFAAIQDNKEIVKERNVQQRVLNL